MNKTIWKLFSTLLCTALISAASSPGAFAEPIFPPKLTPTPQPSPDYTFFETLDSKKLTEILTTKMDAFLAGSPYPTDRLKPKFKAPRYSVRLYRITYDSVIPEMGNKKVRASGLLALPDINTKSLPLISYQHGTVFERSSVPSTPDNSYETQIMLATFAAQGYAVIAADYIGLGASQEPNTYLIQGASTQASLDLLHAARLVLKREGKEQSHLFINGWSQGGFNTLAYLRQLEILGEKVDAAATASAPTDLRVWIARLINYPQPTDAPWIVAAGSNLVMALDTYTLPGIAKEAIKPQYLELAKRFYRFEIGFTEFFSKTPKRAQEFFNAEFASAGNYGTSDFWRLLDRNEVYRWRVKTPLRVYYGEADEAVPPEIARLPIETAKILGGVTQGFSAGKQADHRATYIYALSVVFPWYEQIVNRPTSGRF